MKEFSVSLKEKLRRIDYIVLIAVLGMTSLSILTLYGDADTEAGRKRMLVQLFAAVLGLLCVLVVSMFDYDALLNKLFLPFLGIAVVLMLVTVLFGEGPRPDSTNRCWLKIPGLPFDIQPAEFVKIVFIMTFAKHIDMVKDKINKPLFLLQLLLHAGLIIGLVLVTGDLGSALVFMAIMVLMLYTAGLSLWYFLAAILTVAVAFPYIWPHLKPYQQNRILAGFNPEIDPIDVGYQAIRSRAAIAAGGFRGAGLHGGTYYKLVPAHETDFFFSMLSEKFGFFGAFLYMALMALLIIRLFYLARHARKDCGANICVGVAAIMLAQSIENIGMCLGMLPVVGITLPFLSYGGSSMISTFLCIAVVESVATHNKKYYFERERA